MDKTDMLLKKIYKQSLCIKHDETISLMKKIIFGDDIQPETGLLWISKQNRKDINAIYKIAWFVALGALTSIGGFIIEAIKFAMKHI